MKNTLHKKDDGFTIIEVVLVLAIAGLIFLIVFLALPQLQSSRRDTQRKNDAGRLLAALENWAGNHSGNYPVAGTGTGEMPGPVVPGDPLATPPTEDSYEWMDENISGNFTDPSGDVYAYESAYGDVDEAGEFYYAYDSTNGWRCDSAADGVVSGDGKRDIAVVFELENGQYCQDNQ